MPSRSKRQVTSTVPPFVRMADPPFGLRDLFAAMVLPMLAQHTNPTEAARTAWEYADEAMRLRDGE